MPALTRRPARVDIHPYYAEYVAGVPPGDLLQVLGAQTSAAADVLSRFWEREDHTYAPGKWTVREVMRHVNECERVFGYRALRVARGDTTPLPGFDQDRFITGGRGDTRDLDELLDEFSHLRAANVSLLRGCDDEALSRVGRVFDKDVTVLMIACLWYGHAAHHLRVLDERY